MGLAQERHHEPDSELRDAGGGGVGGVGDGHAIGARGGQVHAVEADADADDELEAIGAGEHALGNGLGAGNQIVDAADQIGDLVLLEAPSDGVLDHLDPRRVEPVAGRSVKLAEGHRGNQKPLGFSLPAPLGHVPFLHAVWSISSQELPLASILSFREPRPGVENNATNVDSRNFRIVIAITSQIPVSR